MAGSAHESDGRCRSAASHPMPLRARHSGVRNIGSGTIPTHRVRISAASGRVDRGVTTETLQTRMQTASWTLLKRSL